MAPQGPLNGSLCSWEMGLEEDYHIPLAVLYLLVMVILFIAIAIVCDDYFVPSLEVICKRLNLSEDVAGATFMAAGSSAPELFTSLAAVTNSSDIGVGTIVGSAVFNILIIISLSAILCKSVLVLDWRPLTRDAMFYGVSIIMFSAFAWDGRYTLIESIVTLLYYFVYIVTLKFNPYLFRLMDLIQRCCTCTNGGHVEPNNVIHTKAVTGPSVHVTPPTDNAHSEDPMNDISMKGLGVPNTMLRTHSSGSSGIGSMTDDTTQPELVDKVWLPPSDSLDSVDMEASGPKSGKFDTPPSSGGPREAMETQDDQTEEEEEEEEWDEVAVCPCDVCPVVMTSLPTRPAGSCGGLRYAINVFYFITAFPFQILDRKSVV